MKITIVIVVVAVVMILVVLVVIIVVVAMVMTFVLKVVAVVMVTLKNNDDDSLLICKFARHLHVKNALRYSKPNKPNGTFRTEWSTHIHTYKHTYTHMQGFFVPVRVSTAYQEIKMEMYILYVESCIIIELITAYRHLFSRKKIKRSWFTRLNVHFVVND